MTKIKGLPGLRRIRKNRKLSLESLAAATGIKYPALQHLEDQAVSVKFDTLRKLALALKCKEADLIW